MCEFCQHLQELKEDPVERARKRNEELKKQNSELRQKIVDKEEELEDLNKALAAIKGD